MGKRQAQFYPVVDREGISNTSYAGGALIPEPPLGIDADQHVIGCRLMTPTPPMNHLVCNNGGCWASSHIVTLKPLVKYNTISIYM